MIRIAPLAAVLAAATALSACSTIGKILPGGDDPTPVSGGQTAPEEGRISILTFEQALTPESSLQGRAISPPAAEQFANWNEPGGTPDNSPPHIAGLANLEVAWRQGVGAGSGDNQRLAAPPVISDGKLFFLDSEQEVHALDAASGRSLWSRKLRPEDSRDNRALGGGLAAEGGRVFVATGFGFVVALDANSGEQVWRAQGGAPFNSAPTVTGGRVYVSGNDSELIALNAADGAVAWTYQAIAEPARILSASSPAVDGDTIIAPFASGEIVALLGANGRRLWVDSLSRSGRLSSLSAINDIAGRPVIDSGVVYAASHSGVLAAIDIRSGQRIWARSFPSTQTPWIAGDVLFAVNVDGELAAFDRATGNVYWVKQLRRYENEDDRQGRVSWTGPILVGGKLILANSRGEVVAANPANGDIVARRDIDAPVFIPPIAANGLIYLVTDDARLVVLR